MGCYEGQAPVSFDIIATITSQNNPFLAHLQQNRSLNAIKITWLIARKGIHIFVSFTDFEVYSNDNMLVKYQPIFIKLVSNKREGGPQSDSVKNLSENGGLPS